MRVVALLSIWLLCPPVAFAQDTARADEAIADAESTLRRLERERDCLGAAADRVRRTRDLMREARAQMRSGDTEAIRRDAGDAIQSLRQRLVELEREALGCREPAPARARSDAPAQGVVYRDAPVDPTVQRVATANPATHLVEQDILLVGNVRAVRGERVDGRGRIDDERVRDVIRSAASGIDRCYDQLVGQRALVRGRVVLTFTIGTDGRLSEIATEGSTIRNARFLSCVRSATHRLRASTPPTGGDATFSYTLELPAS